ncbi:MAG: DUF4147 domain-containing protein [Pyrinomonadaceae bacterium]
MADLRELRDAAREVFDEALAASDARRAVLGAVEFDGKRLRVGGEWFGSGARGLKVFSVALGKAAASMASALDERLGDVLACGVLSAPATRDALSGRWRVFEGGHPLPNEASFEAARAAFDLLKTADDSSSVVLFLVSGGGSAMLELPRDPRLTLEDVREANRALVSCGAPIADVNAVRRALSAVKGGGLAARAPRASQATLVVSDVEAGRAYDVASGPTLEPPRDSTPVKSIVERYGLATRLPAAVVRALEESDATDVPRTPRDARRYFEVLLDNERACEAAAGAARSRGFAVEYAPDLAEQPVKEGAAALVSRLAELYARERAAGARGVCLISGGEFSCPVRGGGTGGRSAETALRVAFEFGRIGRELKTDGGAPAGVVALCAGTDGIDGNSPAAGALADATTLSRARALGLDARKFLDESDAHTLFSRLGDALVTGPTGTNVRDVRVLMAG